MTKARILADYVAGGTTAAEFDYMDGVTSNVQTQLDAKAPLASPTFTGNFTSVGIDDNADATAITIDSSERVGINTADGSATSLLTITQNADTSAIDIYGYDDMSAKKGSLSVNDVGYTQLRSHSDRGMDFKSGETSGSQFRWFSDESQKMTLTAAGKLGLGTTGPNSYIDIVASYADIRLGYADALTDYRDIYFHDANENLYFYNGSNEGYLTSGGAWTNASDERLKKDIENIEYGLAEVLKCKPRKFKLKADNLEQIGFVAQEMLSIIPEVISGGESDEDRPDHLKTFDDGQSQYGLNYGALTAVAFKAIQELSAKNDALEAENTALKTRMDALEARVTALEG